MSAVDWLMLVGLSVLWGGSFFFAKIAVGELPPLTVALGRVAIAAALLVVLARATGVALPDRWRPFLVMGLLNNALPFSLIFWGQTHIPSGLAAILNATTPLFTVLVAHFATADEKLTPARLAGVAAGFAGVVVMIGPDLLRELGADVVAQLACLAAAVSYAFAGVYGRRFRGEPALRVAAGQLVASSALLAPIAARARPAVDARAAERDRVRGAGRARGALDRARLPDLFPHPRARRRDQRAAGHVPDPGERDPARQLRARRGARRASLVGMAAIALGLAAIDGRAGGGSGSHDARRPCASAKRSEGAPDPR